MTAKELRERSKDADRSAWEAGDVGTKERYRNLAWALEGWANALDQLAALQVERAELCAAIWGYELDKQMASHRNTVLLATAHRDDSDNVDGFEAEKEQLEAKLAAAEGEIERAKNEAGAARECQWGASRLADAERSRAEQAEARLAAVRKNMEGLLRRRVVDSSGREPSVPVCDERVAHFLREALALLDGPEGEQ